MHNRKLECSNAYLVPNGIKAIVVDGFCARFRLVLRHPVHGHHDERVNDLTLGGRSRLGQLVSREDGDGELQPSTSRSGGRQHIGWL